jgi:hypothetical protein
MTVETNLDSLDKALETKSYLLQVMRLWNIAKEAGYPHDTIKTFTFMDGYLNMTQISANHRALAARKNPPFSGALYHNAVRLSDGSVAEIPLTRRPEPPAHMKVGRNESTEKL